MTRAGRPGPHSPSAAEATSAPAVGECADAAADGGFTLVEVVVSLLLIAMVMASALQMFVRAMNVTDVGGQRQQAIAIANDQLETVRAVPVTSLITGRSKTQVDTLWALTGASTLTSGTVEYYDSTASGTSTSDDKVPTSLTSTVDGVTYTIQTFVDRCYQPTSTSSTTCGTTSTSWPMYKVTVWVTWSPGKGRKCGTSTTCGYAVATYIDPSSDPTFTT